MINSCGLFRKDFFSSTFRWMLMEITMKLWDDFIVSVRLFTFTCFSSSSSSYDLCFNNR